MLFRNQPHFLYFFTVCTRVKLRFDSWFRTCALMTCGSHESAHFPSLSISTFRLFSCSSCCALGLGMRNVHIVWLTHSQSDPKSSSAQIQRESLPSWFFPVWRRRTKRKAPIWGALIAKLQVTSSSFRSELSSRESTTMHEPSRPSFETSRTHDLG